MKIKPKKVFNIIIFCLFVLFLSLYIASESGYYEYENKEKTKLTEEKIKQFEKDLNEGKRVDLKDYLTNETYNYDNKVTKIGNKLSDIIDFSMIEGLEKTFSTIEKMIE